MRTDLQQITAEQWQRLSQRAVYFGHQSVGENILDGIRMVVSENPQIQLRIVPKASAVSSPGLHEFEIGQNGDPESKNAAFLLAIQGDLGPRSVLLFKYCYVDTDDKTDVRTMFERYQRTVAAALSRHPDADIVHITLPLVVESSLLRYYLNSVRGIATTRTENARRNEYNDMLRRTFAGKEPIFDLADIEATRADGSRAQVLLDGKPVYGLAEEWSSDGGHLNAAGRRYVAERLLATLAALPGNGTTSPATRTSSNNH